MPRPSWKGFIRLSLVSVPVAGYSASAAGETQVALNQLHEACHNRIRYKKVCEVHGEVSSDQIVMGYQFAKDQYAVVDTDELQKLRSERDYAINVDRFVDPQTIDPTYFAGKTYYLMPQGKGGDKAYALLNRAMADERVCGLAQVVISNREQLVLLRPVGRLLTLSVLEYAANVRSPEDFERQLSETDVSKEELKLARMLIDATREEEPSLESYRDLYNERLRELVDSKVEGREVAVIKKGSPPPAINFMEAIRESLNQQIKSRGKAKRSGRPARKPTAKRKHA